MASGSAPTAIDLIVSSVLDALPHQIFLAEAETVGYSPSGAPVAENDLYTSEGHATTAGDHTILAEYQTFKRLPAAYRGTDRPPCTAASASDLFSAHPSHRLDPKYHLFQRYRISDAPTGMVKFRLDQLLTPREEAVRPAAAPDSEFVTLTVHQTGRVTARQPGIGNNPPAWYGVYFRDADWQVAHAGDLIYSRIDLWKGCVAVVPDEFDGAIVTNEFPLYEVNTGHLRPHYLRLLLRTGYFQRAIRAITTGHSNRRRTNESDFLTLEVFLPRTSVQDEIVERVLEMERRINADEREERQVLAEVEELMMGREDLGTALHQMARPAEHVPND